MGKLKVLNLYAGIGGNRKLWQNVDVTAVESDPKIAAVYQSLFPNDKVIVADAHQYLLDHFGEFDFIWSSPPCNTHSKMNVANALSPYKDNSKQLKQGGGIKPRYPDMELYQEIIFLKHFFKGVWVVENVIGYYEPLIQPQTIAKHYIWSNAQFPPLDIGHRNMFNRKGKVHRLADIAARKGFRLEDLAGLDKEKVLRNCTEPELGQHILDNLDPKLGGSDG